MRLATRGRVGGVGTEKSEVLVGVPYAAIKVARSLGRPHL